MSAPKSFPLKKQTLHGENVPLPYDQIQPMFVEIGIMTPLYTYLKERYLDCDQGGKGDKGVEEKNDLFGNDLSTCSSDTDDSEGVFENKKCNKGENQVSVYQFESFFCLDTKYF